MEGLLSLLLFAGFFYLMMRFGCGAHMTHGGHHGSHAGHEDAPAKHVDPVCGMEVGIDQGYGMMHAGRLHRFCSRTCLDKFEAEPERYLQQSDDKTGGGET